MEILNPKDGEISTNFGASAYNTKMLDSENKKCD